MTRTVLILLLTGCGGSSPEPGGEDHSDAGATTGGDAGAGPAWADMDPAQRAQYMAEVVVPTMRPIFQEVDAEEFANFGCPTCHGANAAEVGFEMPNGLAPLDPANIQQLFTSEAPMPVAMRERVWPKMAELLGMALYDPETQEGLSCFNCHATAGASAAH